MEDSESVTEASAERVAEEEDDDEALEAEALDAEVPSMTSSSFPVFHPSSPLLSPVSA